VDGIELVFRQLMTVCETSSPVVAHNCWKKSGGSPSGPRAFNKSICFRASSTSSLTNSAINISFKSGVINVGIASRTYSKLEGLAEWKSS